MPTKAAMMEQAYDAICTLSYRLRVEKGIYVMSDDVTRVNNTYEFTRTLMCLDKPDVTDALRKAHRELRENMTVKQRLYLSRVVGQHTLNSFIDDLAIQAGQADMVTRVLNKIIVDTQCGQDRLKIRELFEPVEKCVYEMYLPQETFIVVDYRHSEFRITISARQQNWTKILKAQELTDGLWEMMQSVVKSNLGV